jgi:hypothetical protein
VATAIYIAHRQRSRVTTFEFLENSLDSPRSTAVCEHQAAKGKDTVGVLGPGRQTAPWPREALSGATVQYISGTNANMGVQVRHNASCTTQRRARCSGPTAWFPKAKHKHHTSRAEIFKGRARLATNCDVYSPQARKSSFCSKRLVCSAKIGASHKEAANDATNTRPNCIGTTPHH